MRRLIIVLMVFMLGISMTSCGSSKETAKVETQKGTGEKGKLVFNIKDIANKSKDEVDNILGIPIESSEEEFVYTDTNTPAKESSRSFYIKDNLVIDVFFIDGVAAQVVTTHGGMDIADLSIKDTFSQIGLEEKPSTSKDEDNIMWEDVYGFPQVWITESPGGEVCSVVISDKKFA